jgi:aminoglycoside/choline kinase family phosphotransferase
MILNDFRMLSLQDWLENDLLLTVISIDAASSDASFRRYFRIRTPDGSFIVMDAPPDKENIQPFIHVAELFKRAKVYVPEIYQSHLTEGFLLLEDLGQHCLLEQLNNNTVDELYHTALASLFTLQSSADIQSAHLPSYDRALLTQELSLFNDWFINHYLDADLAPELWQAVQTELVNSALAQPVCCVHRDYHSRNLMLPPHAPLAMIDFQDAVIGPITYDLVSLLRDCYIVWPEAQVQQWCLHYYQRLVAANMVSCSAQEFTRWFDLMGMQRHLKVMGIFSRLHLRDGKSTYLDDLPRTLNYILLVCSRYPELAEFHQFLSQSIQPKLCV